MEGPAFSMMTSGEGSVDEQHHGTGLSNSSSVVLTVVGGDGEGARGEKKRKGARGTAETKKRSRQDRSGARPEQETVPRGRKADWSKDETNNLLQAYPQISQDKGRFRRTSVSKESFWEAVAQKVQGRSSKECQRRMDTLTRHWKAIKQKGLTPLNERILRSMNLATGMTVDWYNQMCEIKKVPCNARVVITEIGPVEDGDQSSATSPSFAGERLVADPVPHQQDPSYDILPLQPQQASDGGTSAGAEEQLHQSPCPAPPVPALIPGAPVAAPPAPGSHKPRHDAHSPQPAVDAAAPELDLPCDFAPGKVEDVPSLEPEPHPDELYHKDGWIGDGTSTVVPLDHLLDIEFFTDSGDLDGWTRDDTSTAPQDLLDFERKLNPVELAHMEATFKGLELWRLKNF